MISTSYLRTEAKRRRETTPIRNRDSLPDHLDAAADEIDRLRARVVELLEANNREVERRRAAEEKIRPGR